MSGLPNSRDEDADEPFLYWSFPVDEMFESRLLMGVTEMSVGRICIREVDTATPDESAATAARRIHERAVGTLVVVNNESRVIGLLTDRDLVARVLAKGLDPVETLVRDVMTAAPKTVSEDTPIESALSMMRSGRFRRLPVVDSANALVGLVSLDDILMLIAEEFTQVGRLLNRETPRAVVEALNSSGISRLRNEARAGIGD